MARPRPAISLAHPRLALDAATDASLVRSALLHLHDLPYLQNHPLIDRLPAPDARQASVTAGRRLHQYLRQGIEQMRPATAPVAGHDWRGYYLLTWRYVDGLPAPAVQEKLALSKSEYYRDHQQALEAIASVLREYWGTPRYDQDSARDSADARQPHLAWSAQPTGHDASALPRSHNLPCALTTFIGRQEELATLATLPARARLLTLTGVGGVGKTRLALQLATGIADRFPDGVCLVELASLADQRMVASAAATALDVSAAPGKTPLASLVAALRSRRVLLLLDNCEHLLDGCARVIDALLRGCPDVRILATSRQPLGITGEVSWRVPPLATPPACDNGWEELSRHDAVCLFVDRAVAINPSFALTERNAAAVAAICRRLDGIPLALELAAARLNALSVEEITERLDRGFRLLTGGSRTALPRQRTLHATLDWSYALLSAPERRLFRRLAVFAGGWRLAAAEAIGGGEGIAPTTVLDLLAQLVDKSLVLAEEQSDGSERYRLLEPVRQYGRERLEESGACARVEEQHARFFLQLAQELEPRLMSGDRDAALAQLEAEHDNLRRVLGWGVSKQGDGQATEIGLRLAGNLFWFWYFRGYLVEGSRWTETLLAGPQVGALAARAKALLGAGRMAWLLGEDRTARLRLEEGAALWRRAGEEQELAQTLVILAMVTDRPCEARTLLEEGEALFRAAGNRWGLALTLRLQGLHAFHHGDDATARERMEEGLALSRVLQDRWFVAQTLNHLGDVARHQGAYHRAAALYAESLALFREQRVKGGIPSLLHNLGHVALAVGDIHRAEQLFGESLALFREQGDLRGIAQCLAGQAGVLGAQGRPEPAARLFGASEALLASANAVIGQSNQADHERNLAMLRAQLDATSLATAWSEGRAWSQDEAVAYARGPAA
jgi:predicted ATPase